MEVKKKRDNDSKVRARFGSFKYINKGAFSLVLSATDSKRREKVAFKIDTTSSSVQLVREMIVYRSIRGAIGFAKVTWCGKYRGFRAMSLTLMDCSLSDILKSHGGRLGLRTVLMVADEALKRIEYLHRRGWIHRDIKPANIMFAKEKNGVKTLHLVDFGVAARWSDQTSLGEVSMICGTARFLSIPQHGALRPSRRDDLESLAYVLIFLLKGSLPWEDVQNMDRVERLAHIGRLKISTPISDLCGGLPDAFAFFLKLARDLRFDDDPDYAFMRGLFRRVFISAGFVWDGWNWDA